MDTVHGSRCAGPREAARRESDCEIYDSVCWPGSRLLQPVAGYRENRVYFSLELCFDVSSTSAIAVCIRHKQKCERDLRQALPFCQFWPTKVNITTVIINNHVNDVD